jgi:hypothetical protein
VLSLIPRSPSINFFKKSILGINNKAELVSPIDLDIPLGIPGNENDTCDGPVSKFSL